MSNLERAIAIAVESHKGYVDKAGKPYILHPLRVMLQMDSENKMTAAVLHDVVEDTGITLEHLRQEGFNQEVIKAVDSVTRRQGESYDDFILRAGSHRIGLEIKMADLKDNLDISRIKHPTSKDYERLEKYKRAISVLQIIFTTFILNMIFR